jgi:hypothetical protein
VARKFGLQDELPSGAGLLTILAGIPIYLIFARRRVGASTVQAVTR